jgi:hypothetical protein
MWELVSVMSVSARSIEIESLGALSLLLDRDFCFEISLGMAAKRVSAYTYFEIGRGFRAGRGIHQRSTSRVISEHHVSEKSDREQKRVQHKKASRFEGHKHSW